MNTVAIYNINMAKYRLIVKKGNKNQKKMRNIKLVPTYSNDKVEIEKESMQELPITIGTSSNWHISEKITTRH